MAEKENIIISYKFTKEDGSSQCFEIQLDPLNLELIHETFTKLPNWTDLGFNKCSVCPLDKNDDYTKNNHAGCYGIYCLPAWNLSRVFKSTV